MYIHCSNIMCVVQQLFIQKYWRGIQDKLIICMTSNFKHFFNNPDRPNCVSGKSKDAAVGTKESLKTDF